MESMVITDTVPSVVHISKSVLYHCGGSNLPKFLAPARVFGIAPHQLATNNPRGELVLFIELVC